MLSVPTRAGRLRAASTLSGACSASSSSSSSLAPPFSSTSTSHRRRHVPLDDDMWKMGEDLLQTAGLDTQAADAAHRAFHGDRGARSTLARTEQSEAYERHLNRWVSWRRAPRSRNPRRTGVRALSHSSRRAFHTSIPTSAAPATDIANGADTALEEMILASSDSPFVLGDFVEARAGLGSARPEYGFILEPKTVDTKGGPLREKDSRKAGDIINANRYYFLDTNGRLTLISGSDIVIRFPFSYLFPGLGKRLLDDSRLLSFEAEALEGSDTFIIGQFTHLSDVQAKEAHIASTARIRLCQAMNRLLRKAEVLMEDYRGALLLILAQWHLIERHYVHISTKEFALMLQHRRIIEPAELSQLASQQPPSMLSRLVTHQLLMLNHEYFMCDDQGHVSSSLWTPRPERERRDLRAVKGWLDDVDWFANDSHTLDRSSPIVAFGDKAKEAMANGGKVKWSDDDLTIISVLLDAFAYSRQIQPDLYRPAVSCILKLCNFVETLRPGNFDSVSFARFRDDDWKRETGSLSKNNAAVLSLIQSLHIFPGHVTDWSLLHSSSKRVLENALASRYAQDHQQQAHSDDVAPLPANVDLEEHMRIPFHDEVFVIDDPSAQELDDGISIEDADSQGRTWIHVHIADPTSNLTPNELIAKNARRQASSVYLGANTLPMLHGRDFPGLADKKQSANVERAPARVLTFSGLVDQQGLVHDINVMPRSITNRRVLDYADVAPVLLQKADAVQSPAYLHREKLERLKRVTDALRQRRMRDGGFLATNQVLRVKIEASADNQGALTPSGQLPMYLPSPLMLRKPDIVKPLNPDGFIPPLFGAKEHDIDLTYDVESQSQENFSAQILVGECMILAGRAAAAWAARAVDASKRSEAALRRAPNTGGNASTLAITPTTWSDHPLPLPYRRQTFPAQFRTRWLRELRDLRDGQGTIQFNRLIERGIVLPAGELNGRPGEHQTMGIGTSPAGIYQPGSKLSAPVDLIDGCGYVRMTSPLRRYNDLVGHWQIKAILHRAFPRPSAAGESAAVLEALDERRKTMSQGDLQNMIRSLARNDGLIDRLAKNSQKYWALKALRLELERAGRQGDMAPEPTPGKPSIGPKSTVILPPSTTADVGRAHQGGGTHLTNDPCSPLAAMINSQEVTAYVTEPDQQPDKETGKSYVRVLLPAVGLTGFFPTIKMISGNVYRNNVSTFRKADPRPSHKVEQQVGGRYLAPQIGGATSLIPDGDVRVGKEFPVQLKGAFEEPVGGVLLCGHPDGPDGRPVLPRAKHPAKVC